MKFVLVGDLCGIDALIKAFLSTFCSGFGGKVTAPSHQKCVAHSAGKASRHPFLYAWFGRREPHDVLNVR